MKTEIIELPIAELQLLEKNARFMRHEMFQQLVANIKRDGKLTSVPFAIQDEKTGKWKVLSGNHRVMAAKEAGLEIIQVMITQEKLSHAQQVAIQLSHNSIEGQDDPVILRELYESIDNVDDKLYSGIDDKMLDLLEDVDVEGIGEVNLDFRLVSMIFFPDELERIKQTFDNAKDLFKGADETWVARMKDYETFLESMSDIGKAYDVKNVATQLHVLLAIYQQHQTDLQNGYPEAKKGKIVPIASVLATSDIPVALARKMEQRIQKEISKGTFGQEERWKLLECLLEE